MIIRVAEPQRPAFQLRKGEEGLSVFIPDLVDPPIHEIELLAGFRPGSLVVVRSEAEIEAKGLLLVPILGMESLPVRLRASHAEIRPGSGMTRAEFKQALKELE